MEAAKAHIAEFMSRAGRHDTTVDETVVPAITHETVIRKHHENVTGAIDREIHQDHYHTSVQPIVDQVIHPETHEHRAIPIEHREHHHGDPEAVRLRLAEEAALFKDERVEQPTIHTHSEAPVIAGEHRHHHVHEVIQPVIQREVIIPHVIHTTVPVHEVHHNAAKHHATSTLPILNLTDFKAQGGVLTGREARHDGFEGEPRAVANAEGAAVTGAGLPLSRHEAKKLEKEQKYEDRAERKAEREQARELKAEDKAERREMRAEDKMERREEKEARRSSGGYSRSSMNGSDMPYRKPTLKERLDPRIDADGDGKKGFFS